MAAAHASGTVSLSTLPTELLVVIAELLDIPDLLSLSQTSRNTSNVATQFLYRRIKLTAAKSAIQCFRTIIARPHAALAVRYLELRFPYMDFFSSFFRLAAAAIRCTTLVCHLDLSRASPILQYLHDIPLEHLTECVMPYSPDMFFFLHRHENITWLTLQPDIYTVENGHRGIRVPAIRLLKTESLFTMSSMVQLLGPLPSLQEASIYWDSEGNADIITPLLSSPNLQMISNTTPVTNLGLITALATHCHNVGELYFRLDSPYPAYEDETDAFLEGLERSLGAFRALTHIRIKSSGAQTPRDPLSSFEEIGDEFDMVTRWGQLCPKLQSCSLIICGWGRMEENYWIPLGYRKAAEWLGWALAAGKYASLDPEDVLLLQMRSRGTLFIDT
ncbi:hypothetical protein FPV67DRAFT_104026 [Lyophyllum atratum]|nr:hypothetical protein FPV67DRAFT_104026 [Lyophyllum atratum]